MGEYASLFSLVHSYLGRTGVNKPLYDPNSPSDGIGKRNMSAKELAEVDAIKDLEAQIQSGTATEDKLNEAILALVQRSALAPVVPPPPSSAMARKMEAAADDWSSFRNWLVGIGVRDTFFDQIFGDMTAYLQSDEIEGPSQEELCFLDADSLQEALPTMKGPVIKRMMMGIVSLRANQSVDFNSF
jgi:hypothetical protein